MELLVRPNGGGDGKGTHVSVYLRLLPGVNDDTLEWPLRGWYEVSLLNQLADRAHHSHVITHHYCRIHNPCDSSGWGFNQFISQSALHYNAGKQYLKDDSLYFRITVTNMESKTKPWLAVQ